ncbi:MAG: type I glyceraldehyde-3-phosphate dehydrogenase [Holosporales bacterium]|jgi:glyceraldehyde 3-phosphate dehydrogenase|nr:type I glyceraldehyde-3-phosphate dehydrogenase [Holosporales bacterium]
MVNVGINGFGRIGRMVVRAYFESRGHYNDVQIKCINDISDKDTNIHLLKYDSVHGRAPFDIIATDSGLSMNGSDIRMLSEPVPEKIDWAAHGVDIVLECSGRFTKRVDAERHVRAGAKRVIVSAPSEGADITVVYGINHTGINSSHTVISNGSCTTNCIAPIIYILDKEFSIEVGYMTTIHAYTGDQKLIDTVHKDLRRARAAAVSMIPSSTGAARAVGLILPHLSGKLDGCAIRVPTANVSLVDFKCLIKKRANADEVNALMKKNSTDGFCGILAYNDEPLVSVDFNHSKESSIFDASGTKVLSNGDLGNGNFVRVMAWYDNEFGFSNRMLDLCQYMASV